MLDPWVPDLALDTPSSRTVKYRLAPLELLRLQHKSSIFQKFDCFF